MTESDDVQTPPQKPVRRRAIDANRCRAPRACDGCRRVKERCEGGMPCRRCTHLKRPCVFSGASTKIAPPPSTTATNNREDERPSSSAQLPDATSAELERRVANLQRIVRHYVGDVNLDAEAEQRLADSLDPVAPGPGPMRGVSQEVGAESTVTSAEDLKLDDITVQPLENNVTHYSGEFSHWNFSMRIKNWIDSAGPYRTDAPDAPKIREFYRVEELQAPADTSKLLDSCPPRGIADFLTRVFFNYTESNYFYIDRTWLNRKLDVIYDSPSSLTQKDVPALCIVFMVFAIGTQYAYLDCRNNGGSEADQSLFSEDNVGITLYQQACRLLPDVITIASFESVQACLLIGLYTLPLDPSGLSWVYLNLASKLAIQNGMHRKAPDQALHPYTSEMRNRVWWTVMLLEKRVGTLHGRPLSISGNDVDAGWPLDRPEIWPGSPPTNTAYLVATLQLGQFLGHVSNEISRFKKQNRNATLDALGRLVQLKEGLHKWWHNLPDNVSYVGLAAGITAPRAALHLRLEFCMVRMYAGRLFIVPPQINPAGATSKSPPEEGGSPQNPQKRRSLMIMDCVDAALSVVDTCRFLKQGLGLARASYTEFSTLRIALLVILSQFLAKQSRTDKLREPLCEGLAMLKSMSNWGASARFDASLVEAFEHAIARMEYGPQAQATSSSQQESSYEMFKKWESTWASSSTGPGSTVAKKESSISGVSPLAATSAVPWRDPSGFGPPNGAATVTPETVSTLGIDWTYSTMPMLEGLSAMLEDGYGFGTDNSENHHSRQGVPGSRHGF